MGPFIAVFGSAALFDGASAKRIDGVLKAAGWSRQPEFNGYRLYAQAGRPAATLHLGSDVVIGSLFDDETPIRSQIAEVTPGSSAQRARHLLERFWGRYVAILRGRDGQVEAVLRDPSGGIDVFLLAPTPLTVIASEWPDSLMSALDLKVSIDWNVVHDQLTDIYALSGRSALTGVQGVTPGALLDVASRRERQLWRPASFARRSQTDAPTAQVELRRRVHHCIAAQARSAGPILAEVSGGLDSSIVASALAASDANVVVWLHHTGGGQGSDERCYADALAAYLGVRLETHVMEGPWQSPSMIALSADGPRPSINALDPLHDEAMVAAGRAHGARTFFSGHGGDGLFYQSPLPEIAVDFVRRRGQSSLFSQDFVTLAWWLRTSVWRLAATGLIGRSPRNPFVHIQTPQWVAPRLTQAPLHPWMEQTEDLPPAKRHHLEEVAHALLYHGRSQRGQAFDLVHPLLSQPVIEHCLSIPVDLLVQGGRDRALARRAFADDLPKQIAERRSKGELGAYYSLAFSAALPAIREYLLDGRLVQHDLLLRRPLESALESSALAEHGGHLMLARAVAIEAWTRRWGQRCT
jgi:asparagine synthase (glutamine-hydrolysing)